MSRVWSLVLAAVLTLGVGLTMKAYADQSVESGVDRPGQDYRRIELEPGLGGYASCQGVCVADRGCTSWTFVASGVQGPKAVCYLKFGIPAAFSNPCCVSGVVARTSEPNIDRAGMDYGSSLAVDDAPECRSLCQNDGRCQSWTFVVRGVQARSALCYLKDGVPDAREDDCCTSGVKNGAPTF